MYNRCSAHVVSRMEAFKDTSCTGDSQRSPDAQGKVTEWHTPRGLLLQR